MFRGSFIAFYPDFAGRSAVENLPANAGDVSSSVGWEDPLG